MLHDDNDDDENNNDDDDVTSVSWYHWNLQPTSMIL